MASSTVLPTHVGMSRWQQPAFPFSVSAPHTRGDEPLSLVTVAQVYQCSPHTWG